MPAICVNNWPANGPEDGALRVFDTVDSTNNLMTLRHRRSFDICSWQSFKVPVEGVGGVIGMATWLEHCDDRGLLLWSRTLIIVYTQFTAALWAWRSFRVFEQLDLEAQVKWPNDIWVADRKLAGVLVELVQTQGDVTAVIGIGVNVNLGEFQRHRISLSTDD